MHAALVVIFLLFAATGHANESSHAETQLSAILESRPTMARSIESRPAVRDWILERFRVTDPPLFWSPDPPVSGRLAECDARDSTLTYVRVMPGRSGIDQLVQLLFELHNVQGYDVFDELFEAAFRGDITREEFAVRSLEQEFRALLAARQFYREHVADLSRSERREARAYYRMLYGTDSFEEHVREVRERGFDLLDHWRELYDTVVLPEREPRSGARPEAAPR